MTIKHQTMEEKAYWQLLKDTEEMLSEEARTVLSEACSAAYAAHMVRSYCFQWPIEYEEAMDKMHWAAADLTDRDQVLLAKLWRAALAAAASMDAHDYETPAGYRVNRACLHDYYRMLSRMVEVIVRERSISKLMQRNAKSKQKGDSDAPL